MYQWSKRGVSISIYLSIFDCVINSELIVKSLFKVHMKALNSLHFLLLQELLIKQYSFLPFVVLLFIFLIFIYRRVPETKGKTIEQISLLFKRPETVVFEKVIQEPESEGYRRLQHDLSSEDS